jgi:acyl-CoA synthetase (AMP-forming)/AMP-acid ligase II
MALPLTINDFLDRALAVYPDRVAIIDEPDQPAPPLPPLTYRQLGDIRRSIGVALDELGVPFGGRVAVVSQNSARFLTMYYGIPGNGRVIVPINFRLKPDEVAYIVEHSGAEVLLVDPEVAPSLADIACKHVIVFGEESDTVFLDRPGQPMAWEPDEHALVSIDYTSGTTARPKGVEQTHRARWTNTMIMGWQFGITDRDTYLHLVPMFHCDAWAMPYNLSAMGVTQVVQRKVDGPEILRRVERYGVTFTGGSPAVCAAVLDAAARWDGEVPGSDRVRIIVAGAPPPTTTIERIETDLRWEFIQLYGLTETAPMVTVSRRRAEWDHLTPSARAQKLGRAGAPAIGVAVRVSEEGEILARANHILTSYWNDPGATAEALEGGWFHTGDGGTVDDEGYYAITDRRKDVIISGGENVSSIEVEDVLFSHPAVAEVAVIGVPHERWGETVKALVVVVDGASPSERELIEHCRSRLAGYKCPTSVELRTELPRTATGKLQKYKLREPFWIGMTKAVN